MCLIITSYFIQQLNVRIRNFRVSVCVAMEVVLTLTVTRISRGRQALRNSGPSISTFHSPCPRCLHSELLAGECLLTELPGPRFSRHTGRFWNSMASQVEINLPTKQKALSQTRYFSASSFYLATSIRVTILECMCFHLY